MTVEDVLKIAREKGLGVKAAYSAREAGKLIGARNRISEAVARGEIRAIRHGKRWVIPVTEIARYLSGEAPQERTR